MFFKELRNYIGEFRAYNRERKQVVCAGKIEKKERLKGRIIRFVHAIEKGLSIDSPRPGFGYEKIKVLYEWIKEYLTIEDADRTCVYMASDVLCAYSTYHDSINVSSEKIEEIREIANELSKIKADDKAEGIYGGVKTINKEEMLFDFEMVENLFKTRHSIRQFKKEPVSKELIAKAIELAQCAPSACNRQAVRTYVIDAKKFVEEYPSNLQGIGGFVESGDKVIIITGKIAPYEESEYKQFVVSAGIFVGYLDLALHSLGLGACVVQRSLRPNDEWETFRFNNAIPIDEQVVCMMVIGHMNDKTIVPVSRRFEKDVILRYL